MPVNEFEKQVQQKLNELQLRPTPAVWTEVEKQIRKEKKRRRIIIFWWLLPVLLTGGIATWYFTNNQGDNDELATSVTLQEKQNTTAPGTFNPKAQTNTSQHGPSQTINDQSTIVSKTDQSTPGGKTVVTPQQKSRI